LVIALVVFFLVIKPANAMIRRYRTEPAPDPTVRKCPECLSDIPTAANRCAFCTTEVGPGAA
jgi:large conductance mechanosensitive channel